MIGQSIGAYIDATHGMTLSAVSIPHYKFILPYGIPKCKRYAVNVWDVDPAGKTDQQIALERLEQMEAYVKEQGRVMHIADLGVTEDMLEGIADDTLIMQDGYRMQTKKNVVQILKESM